jgi:hypothetical protein
VLTLRADAPLRPGHHGRADLPQLLRPRRASPRDVRPVRARHAGQRALADRAGLPQLLQRRRPDPGGMRALPPVPPADRPGHRRRRALRGLCGDHHRLHLPAVRPVGLPLRPWRLCLLRARRRSGRAARRTRRHRRTRPQAPHRGIHPGPPAAQRDQLGPAQPGRRPSPAPGRAAAARHPRPPGRAAARPQPALPPAGPGANRDPARARRGPRTRSRLARAPPGRPAARSRASSARSCTGPCCAGPAAGPRGGRSPHR